MSGGAGEGDSYSIFLKEKKNDACCVIKVTKHAYILFLFPFILSLAFKHTRMFSVHEYINVIQMNDWYYVMKTTALLCPIPIFYDIHFSF